MKTTKSTSDSAHVRAVATGFDKPPPAELGRARKSSNPSRSTIAVKKKKDPKPPRNPFHRSVTGKLQLERLQMGKRVENMAPRVEVMRERLNVMQTRLDYVSGKLKLVVEGLTTRAYAGQAVGGGVEMEIAPTGEVDEEEIVDDDENIALDDEEEQGTDDVDE